MATPAGSDCWWARREICANNSPKMFTNWYKTIFWWPWNHRTLNHYLPSSFSSILTSSCSCLTCTVACVWFEHHLLYSSWGLGIHVMYCIKYFYWNNKYILSELNNQISSEISFQQMIKTKYFMLCTLDFSAWPCPRGSGLESSWPLIAPHHNMVYQAPGLVSRYIQHGK